MHSLNKKTPHYAAYGFATNGQSEWNHSFIKALKGVSPPDARLLFRSSFQLSRLQPKYKWMFPPKNKKSLDFFRGTSIDSRLNVF